MKRTFATVLLLFLLFVHGMRGQAPPSAEDRSHLLAVAREMRPHFEHMLKAAELIQKTPSIQERERIYCHSQVYAFPLIPKLGTFEEVESDYVQFAAHEAATQAEQVKRQYALRAAREQLAQAHENMQTCIDLFANGWQAFPTNGEEANFVDNMRRALRAIDHPDASLAPSSVDLPTATTLPDHDPVIVYKVEAEKSEEARRAKWQGDIDVTLSIDETGKVTNVTVLNSPGMGMDAKVIQAFSRWRFKPKIKDGVPVASRANARMSFRLL
jgi:TonB family protein